MRCQLYRLVFPLAGILSSIIDCFGYTHFVDINNNLSEIRNYGENEIEGSYVWGRNRRFLSMRQQQNKNYPECLTPTSRKGHCKHASHCTHLTTELQQSIWKLLGYLCVVDRFSIGLCCPDPGDASENSSVSEQDGVDFDDDTNGKDLRVSAPVWTDEIDPTDQPIVEAMFTRPEDRGCGIATKSLTRVTGGRPADPGEWPWMAALLRRGGAPNAFCGGVLITDRHVLTAAHCTRNYRSPSEVFVRLGEYDFAQFNETRARDFRVTDIRSHLGFDESTYENDICILKLAHVTAFNRHIWPVCMPPMGEDWSGRMGIVTGWGTQSYGGPRSDVLMEVAIPVWTHQRCQEAFTNSITTTSRVLCAGDRNGGRDSCQGDSGGPMLTQLPNRRWVVIGIVSWGIRCGEPNHPGIYTKVDAYNEWILENAIF